MFEIGQYVIYGRNGVCRVENIGKSDISGASSEKLYYTLTLVYTNSSKIFTPVDNVKVIMRPILTQEEATQLIDRIEDIDTIWVPEEKCRESIYKEAIASCDCYELVKIIKTLYFRKEERLADNKKLTAIDNKYLKLAEDNLYGELAYSLQLDKDAVVDYIKKRIEQLNA